MAATMTVLVAAIVALVPGRVPRAAATWVAPSQRRDPSSADR
ncbi:hypothetical protein SAMN05216184_105119 [Georgenia satyanarayanai]|uniref:Uncharacterized protein n=1 Tax=Georgenia satyanarayanai TaxID=860221 RepID=A0A2Y9C5T4_9MICO|nr:hypothetical protein [Georgenia satyanarayanai]PYF99876.1 hypothetical protein A8987_105119 [Georgenia satyanarayanai]SSA41863.1 hypothetical protein SAMN05216184_105119 [Georgenia satyanarayanai]